MARAGEIKGELLMVWGRQDPHIPTEGRMQVLARLNEVGTKLNWHEVNGAHAFMRDEGPRYDPEAADQAFGVARPGAERKVDARAVQVHRELAAQQQRRVDRAGGDAVDLGEHAIPELIDA